MFVYQSQNSTAVMNYVSRYYEDDDPHHENRNVLITRDLNRQQWEENGFILVHELPYNLGSSRDPERSSHSKASKSGRHRDRRFPWSTSTAGFNNQHSSPEGNDGKRGTRRLEINDIINDNLSFGVHERHPGVQHDPNSSAMTAVKDWVINQQVHETVSAQSIESKYYLHQECQPAAHSGFPDYHAAVHPVVDDAGTEYMKWSTVSPDGSHKTNTHNGVLNSAYVQTGDEFDPTHEKNGGKDLGKKESPKFLDSGFWFWYSKFLVRFPTLFCAGIFVLTVAAGAVAFTLYDLPKFDDPEKGFEARHTPIRDRLTGLELFHRITDDASFHILHRTSISKRSLVSNWTSTISTSISGQVNNDSTTPTLTSTEQSIDNDGQINLCVEPGYHERNMRIVFSVVNSRIDLFSADAFHSMCRIYDEHIRPYASIESTSCHEPTSLGQYAAYLQNKSSCYDVNEDDVIYLSEMLSECVPHYINGDLLTECTHATCPTVPQKCRSLNAAYAIFHYLLPSGSASKIARGELDMTFTLMITPISGNNQSSGKLYTDRIQGRNDLRDNCMKITAIGGQFKFDLFGTFLFSDIVLVAFAVGVIMVIICMYTRSLFITFMTLLDMAMALVLSYFVYVVVIGLPFFPFVNILAIILVLGIGADDTFVYMDLWRKTGEKYTDRAQNRVKILQETLHHAATTMFVTSFTTSSALFFSITSSITAIKCFAVYSGCAILFNFLFTLTWLPALVIIEERYLRFNRCWNRKATKCSCCKAVKRALKAASRQVFEKALPTVVFKLRHVWLIIFTLLGVGGGCAIFVYPRLQLPTQSQFQIFVRSDFLEQYDQVFIDYFDFEQRVQNEMPIKFVWGLESKDNGNSWDPDDRGSLILDNQFNISAPKSQEWLMNFCSDVKNQTFYSSSGINPDFCFIDVFRRTMMESPCENPVYQQNVSPCCENYDFPYEPELFEQCAAMFVSLGGLEQVTRFGRGEKLSGLQLSFTSNTKYSLNYESIDAFWIEINRWSRQEMDKAPESISHGWFVSFNDNQLYFFDLQQSLVTGFPFSIGMSLGVAALVLLLTTWNVLVTIYAILSISGTVFVTVGSLVFIGWELNILESTIMSLAVGLSVDFTIHYGVAYRIAPKGDRVFKSMHAMRQLTSAISTAALSTFVAGVCMLPATVLSYQQIGVFLALIMGVSWAYGTFFFMSLCMIFGPGNNCCRVQSHCSTCCCRKSKPIEKTKERQRHTSDFHSVFAS